MLWTDIQLSQALVQEVEIHLQLVRMDHGVPADLGEGKEGLLEDEVGLKGYTGFSSLEEDGGSVLWSFVVISSFIINIYPQVLFSINDKRNHNHWASVFLTRKGTIIITARISYFLLRSQDVKY